MLEVNPVLSKEFMLQSCRVDYKYVRRNAAAHQRTTGDATLHSRGATLECAPSDFTEVQGYFANENSAPLGPYSRNVPRALWWSWGGGLFLMSELDATLQRASAPRETQHWSAPLPTSLRCRLLLLYYSRPRVELYKHSTSLKVYLSMVSLRYT